jgi:hypothetical protein
MEYREGDKSYGEQRERTEKNVRREKKIQENERERKKKRFI